MKLKGYILAAIAAATYGTNPAFAVPLYEQGMNPASVLLFRYLFCLPILALMALGRGRSLSIRKNEIWPLAISGILMGISSITLFAAYNYMNSGIASTLLFIYPVMVAVIMSVFYHEPFRATTGLCLVVMGAGLIMLMHTGPGVSLSLTGCLLVFLSSITYAIYLVMTNISKVIKSVPTLKLLFYQFLFGSIVFLCALAAGQPLTLPSQSWGWINLLALAMLPSVVSLGCTTLAIHRIGSTATAIFGALEPLTAVILSIVILGQTMTPREAAGGVLILIATTLIVVSDPVDKAILRVRKLFPPLRNSRRQG